ncbi:DUF2199 domain-containing protein [Streptomyces avidinii]|uniref:DUF2199 domain-containing protein n=1 Tax=Streptomyces avidinii TaxID=1895 RepID=A0ABS4LAD5_STRAV|nr:DUF2199 domain-containing protein [Streptomyces avidinii]MBP2039059.1 hypothetical protein [Streptomyces avidinii]GGZ22550.1 hypothetical protein GCM10010343_57380 [Streptomyces avidinii]
MTTHLPACACCGDALADERRIDFGFNLPDAALRAPEEALHRLGVRALLRVDGVGCFVRCLLGVRLTHDTELVLGAWVQVDDATLRRAHDLWEQPGYADLVVRGTFANRIQPWGDTLLGAEVTAKVADPAELPCVVEVHRPAAARVLTQTWDRDHVLSRFPYPVPVDVRTDLGDHWSVVRTAGLTASFADGTDHFTAPDRSAAVSLMTDDVAGRAPADFLTALLSGAPDTRPDQRAREPLGEGLRHAFWLTPQDHGRPRHEFYGMAVAAGTAAGIFCTYEDPAGLEWALRIWRSLDRAVNTP